jgi:hypothetical protein
MQTLAKILLVIAIISASGLAVHAAAPPQELVDKLQRVIREHCPDAVFEVDEKRGFVAKHGTMQFLVHDMSSFGEFLPTTHFEEGPNFKGFLLQLKAVAGTAEVALAGPQTLERQYFPTYLDAPPPENGESRYLVSFAYGRRLDPKLKKAIFEAIPRTKVEGDRLKGQSVAPGAANSQ